MPLSATDIIQSNSGGFDASSGNATLPIGTTAGNTVIIAVTCYAQTPATPTNFTRDSIFSSGVSRLFVFRRSNMPAGDTTWAVGSGVTAPHAWIAYEINGALEFDTGAATIVNTTSGTTVATGSQANTTYDGVAMAFHSATDTGATPPTLSAQTGGFVELNEQSQVGATKSVTIAVSAQFTQILQTFQSTATCSATLDVTDPAAGWMGIWSAPSARRAADVCVMAGFEWGTAAGLIGGNVGNSPFDSITGTPTITTATPRSGTYCLELPATATADQVSWSNGGAIGLTPITLPTKLVFRVCFRFVGALPTSDVDLFSTGVSTTARTAFFRFRVAGSNIGLQVQGLTVPGTEVFSLTTVVPDVWYAVDVRFDKETTTWVCDWQLDGVNQPQASKSGESAEFITNLWVGRNTTPGAAPPAIRYDDIVATKVANHYPIGELQILPLPIDPAGTLTISGSAANFSTFSSNGTLAAWNAATAHTAIGELPPTIGASADGLVQSSPTSAATDYVEIPMSTISAAPDGMIRAVRLYLCGWAGGAGSAAFKLRDFDGTTEHILESSDGDINFNNSTTTPAWLCRMAGRVKSSGGAPLWSQAKLDALVARVGFVSLESQSGPAPTHQSETFGIANTAAGNYDTTVTPAAAPDGVCVIIIAGSVSDLVTSASYGGVALTRLRFDTEATEAGAVYIYWGPGPFPAGAQTARVVRTGTVDMRAVWYTMTCTAGSTIRVEGTGTGTSASVANPSWTIATTASVDTQCYEGIHSGLQTMTNTPQTTPAWTLSTSEDLGNIGRGWARFTSTGGTVTCGWIAATAEDFVGSSVAFSEFTPTGLHALIGEVGIAVAPPPQPMFGDVSTGDVVVTAVRDVDTAGILGLTTTTGNRAGAALHYEMSGVPTDVVVPVATSDSKVLDAPDAPTTNYVAIYPDPEPGSVT